MNIEIFIIIFLEFEIMVEYIECVKKKKILWNK